MPVFPSLAKPPKRCCRAPARCSTNGRRQQTLLRAAVMANGTKFELELDGLFLENATYDYNDYRAEADPFPQVSSRLLPTLYALVLLGGSLGNGLVLLVLCRLQRSWRHMDTLVLHLSVADLLLLITLPFWAAEAAQGWTFGTPLCKLMGAIFKIKTFCGIFLLACISLDRYVSIVHAVQMYSRRKPWQVQASCLFVWFICLILSIPDWVFLEQQFDGRSGMLKCDDSCLKYSASAYRWCMASRLLYHIVGFLIPSVLVVFCHSSILLFLHHKSQKLQTQKSLPLILALLVAFFIFWTPFSITLMVDTMYQREDLDYSLMPVALMRALALTNALGCLHTLLNPILYTCLCLNFRYHALYWLRLSYTSPPDHRISLWDDPMAPEEKHNTNQMVDMEKTCY